MKPLERSGDGGLALGGRLIGEAEARVVGIPGHQLVGVKPVHHGEVAGDPQRTKWLAAHRHSPASLLTERAVWPTQELTTIEHPNRRLLRLVRVWHIGYPPAQSCFLPSWMPARRSPTYGQFTTSHHALR